MRAALLPFLLLALPQLALCQSQELNTSDIVARSAGAVVIIKTFDESGRLIGLGSGFRVASGRVVTNAHVIAGAARLEMFDSADQLLGTTSFAEAVSTTVDLAILPRLGTRSTQLTLAATLPRVGERVVVIGAPEGLSNTVSDGLVSGIRTVEGRNLLQISAPISPGSSGGPVLNPRGEVIGVSVSMLKEGQNLNFAVPLPDVIAMLASPAGRIPFPPEAAAARGQRVSGHTSSSHFDVIRLGQSIDGTLGADDDTLPDGRLLDAYRVQLPGGARITVGVQSKDFDSYVFVFRRVNDSLARVAFDDDSGGGVNAEANFVAPATGAYEIYVFSASEKGGSGDYHLSVERDAPAASSSTVSTESERWVATGRSSSGTQFSYDRTRIVRSGDGIYRTWSRREERQAITNSKGDSYDHVLSLEDVDCRRARSRNIQLIEYLGGTVVYSSDSEPGEWSAWVPETVGERHFQTLCGYVAARGL